VVKIRKIILISTMCMILIISGVMAAEDNAILSEMDYGDPDYNVKIQELGIINTWLLKLNPFTVIGGATCSLYPDRTKDYTPSSNSITRLCYTNNNHKGVAFQLFKYSPREFLGEKQIVRGEKKCFDVEYGVEYWYDLYYCDSTTERTCADSDGGIKSKVYGRVDYSIDGVTNRINDKCDGPNYLQERYCDDDNSVATKTYECNCENGKCVTSSGSGSSGGNDDDEPKPINTTTIYIVIGVILALIIGGLILGRRK
jgi:hypothetical protein